MSNILKTIHSKLVAEIAIKPLGFLTVPTFPMFSSCLRYFVSFFAQNLRKRLTFFDNNGELLCFFFGSFFVLIFHRKDCGATYGFPRFWTMRRGYSVITQEPGNIIVVDNKMAEVKVQNLLRLYKLRDKFDAVILAVHACLVEREFRCINSGEEVS